jgi:hypothetical protein
MPRLMTDDMEQTNLPNGNFSFTNVRMARLLAASYTLVTILVDKSGSVEGFQADLENCVAAAVNACKLSPNKENILLRVVTFANAPEEVHGFRPLADLKDSDYAGCVQPGGSTALHETLIAAIEATRVYANKLQMQDYDVNGAIFAMTDGLNNNPPLNPESVLAANREAVKAESLGTLTTVLIGLNDQATEMHDGQMVKIGDVLQKLHDKAAMTQYVGIADANPKELARLGKFISRSISSSSKALASGGAKSVPQPVTF